MDYSCYGMSNVSVYLAAACTRGGACGLLLSCSSHRRLSDAPDPACSHPPQILCRPQGRWQALDIVLVLLVVACAVGAAIVVTRQVLLTRAAAAVASAAVV